MSLAHISMVVSIGKERRLTLAELQAIDDVNDAASNKLIWQGEESFLEEDLGLLSIEQPEQNEDGPSVALSRSGLALLALHLANASNEKAAFRIVHLLNNSTTSSLQSSSPALGDILAGISKQRLDRSFHLAEQGILLLEALQLAQISLPIAALTTDVAMGRTATFPENLLHRTMNSTATTMRSLLQSSRFEGCDLENIACASIPYYFGAAFDDLKECTKAIELEVNAPPSPDDTMLQLKVAQAQRTLLTLTQKSYERVKAPTEATAKSLLDAVAEFRQALTLELNQALSKVRQVSSDAAEKAQAKAQKQADFVKPDEFDGKSDDEITAILKERGIKDGQITKMLRKRAEKAEKAAAKKREKEGKGSSVFSLGTATFVEFFETSERLQLSPKTCTEAQELVEKILSGGVQRTPRIAIGTRDYLPEEMMIRQEAFAIIRRVFAAHGAVEIDTPVFELKETLTGKYGEDSKLIYDLADQGGELLALRYDLTVPFARFLAKNSVGNIKRFHIGKVYRRDRPTIAKGRYREFYQCDFDIAGTYSRMVPDSECICVACDILDALPIGNFGIKLNHRRLLDAILDLCGVPAEKFRTICSAVDKLDKEPWSEVKREMVEDKGLESSVADKIGEFVLNKGLPKEMYQQLMDSNKFGDHPGASEAMEDLRILFDYLEAMDKLKFISFDLSLARGLDYYTGVIYEAVCMSGNSQVGSIGGGGRYDNLVSMFQGSGDQTPCVGVSVGIERVFTLMEQRMRDEQGTIKRRNVDIYISTAGAKMIKEKMAIARLLWNANLSAEFGQTEGVRLKKELPLALDRGIPFMIIVGEDELKEKKVVVKDLNAKTEEAVAIDNLVKYLRQRGVVPVGCEFAADLMADPK